MPQFAPQPIELNVPLLKSIARQLNKTLTVYDLETTNLVGVSTFGITDVAAVHIHPNRTGTQQPHFRNRIQRDWVDPGHGDGPTDVGARGDAPIRRLDAKQRHDWFQQYCIR